ncbi:MAG: VCBS repeat-containing protein [Pyrinomonadaceae bacterium]|nr:VCBS repeat-containing protein [Pyrinomonadaceae bacterium]
MRACDFVISLAASMLLFIGSAVKADAQRTFVVPHFIEKVGLVNTTQFTFDTTFFVTYLGGIGNDDLAPGASIDLYIFDDLTGQPLKSLTNIDVCNPCSFTVNTANRKAIGNVEGIANSVGGLPRVNVTGSMLFIAAGDVEEMAIVAHVINAHTSPQDLSSFPLLISQPKDGVADFQANSSVFREDSMLPSQPFSFSTDLNAFYAGEAGATVNLRLYDDLTGLPLLSMTNQPVCNPCSVNLTNINRKHLFSFDALIRAAGGFPRPDVRGFATLEVTGDTKNVSVQDIGTNTHTGPNDVELHALDPQGGPDHFYDRLTGNTFVIPHILEKQGTITNIPFTFDTSLLMTYMGGLPGFPTGSGADIDLFLFDETTGQVMTNQGLVVCGPCNYTLTQSARKQSILVDDLITRDGTVPFDTGVKLGFGVIVVGGQDPDGINIQGFVTNTHAGAFDLSVFGFEPQPILGASGAFFQKPVDESAERPNGRSEGGRRILAAEYDYPHFRDRTGKASNTTFTFDSEFHAVYNGTGTATLELYLYDQMTSQPLMSLTNQPVCNPCNLPLNTTTKKRRIIVDDLITAAGGFPRLDVAGFARIRVTGDAGRVAILAMLINAHSGPNDLSTSELRTRTNLRRATDFDFTGDGRADIGVFRPNDPAGSMFYLLQTGSNLFNAFRWGLPTDRPVTEDYDGDGKTDIAVWRPTLTAADNLYIFQSLTLTVRAEHFGVTGDNPLLTADFDGDGKADPAVYREGATPGAQSNFYYRPSTSPGIDFRAMPWGINGDRPLRGDYDGDGKADFTVFRPSNGVWYILQSATSSLRAESWGLPTDKFVPADYDGDGRTDLAVFRGGIWYIKRSREDLYEALFWGLVNDLPVPGDFDGDGQVDVAVFREGIWYILQSNGQTRIAAFGVGGDLPLPLFQ